MPAQIDLENSAETPITSYNYGSVAGSGVNTQKFYAANSGDIDASSVTILITRIAQNDGIDFVDMAPDVAGNPGTYQTSPLNIGTLSAGANVAFWVRVSVPGGTTPFGNPRQFDIVASYTGT